MCSLAWMCWCCCFEDIKKKSWVWKYIIDSCLFLGSCPTDSSPAQLGLEPLLPYPRGTDLWSCRVQKLRHGDLDTWGTSQMEKLGKFLSLVWKISVGTCKEAVEADRKVWEANKGHCCPRALPSLSVRVFLYTRPRWDVRSRSSLVAGDRNSTPTGGGNITWGFLGSWDWEWWGW